MKILNHSEQLTLKEIKNAVIEEDVHIFSKVRIADTLPINGSGISHELFSYSLKSHFDFVISDLEYEPLFAVEFDGPLHRSSEKQRQRDLRKNEICQRFSFPLLRINSNYINRQYRGLNLLSYFIHTWFLSKSFEKAQEQGSIPDDEIFSPSMVIEDSQTNKSFPFWLSLDLQADLQKMCNQGLILNYAPSCWIGVDHNGAYRCLSWLHLSNEKVIYTQTGMQGQIFPIDEVELLQQIVIFDLHKMLHEYFSDGSHLSNMEAISVRLGEYQSSCQMVLFSKLTTNL